ncbi:MAG: hypothetical protein GVY13_17160 [Alphaproteobacteria bacterium]|jgi:hypothetical protein|nr:hypothetical protein [Alphaproteobacteria bacterium]
MADWIQGFSSFLDSLHGKTVAVVYSFSNRVEPKLTWYDRWRSDVVFFFGAGIEKLGASPRYIDVDLYLKEMAHSPETMGDYILNLHSGLLQIASWPIIASGASWARIPVAPCASDVHIVGERKDLANALAATTKLRLPKPWKSDGGGAIYVRKPRDLGMSRGLQLLRGKELHDVTFGKDIVQEFIEGFDATVAIVLQPNLQYSVIGAQLLIPEETERASWTFSEEEKLSESTKPTFVRRNVAVDPALRREIYALCEKIGYSSIYRIDFRIDSRNKSIPEQMSLDNSFFLEANPTPTVSRESGFGHMLKHLLSLNCKEHYELDPCLVKLLQSLKEEAAIVGLMLYASEIAT